MNAETIAKDMTPQVRSAAKSALSGLAFMLLKAFLPILIRIVLEVLSQRAQKNSSTELLSLLHTKESSLLPEVKRAMKESFPNA